MIADMRLLIEERMAQRPTDKYRYPLGYCTWGAEEVEAALECLCDQRTTMWEKCELFENEFAAYIGTGEAVMVNSGSSANLIMMLAAKEMGWLKPGDEILIPAVTWPTQVWAAIQAGFKVKLVDVEVSTLNTSPEILEAAITPKTKAIFLVHLMGSPCQMNAISMICARHDLRLFEDCCEALGASMDGQRVGSFGIAATFSFFASHHISTMEGGMIFTSDATFAEQCRLMRAHGWARDLKNQSGVETLREFSVVDDPRYLFLNQGFNFRPTELQGAIGSIQLRKLDALNATRNKHARMISEQFRVTNGHFIEGLLPTSHYATPAWFAAPFVLREGLPYTRKDVTDHLNRHGIDTRPIVGGNLARHPAFWKYPDMAGSLPGANAIHDRGWYCGLSPNEGDDINGLIGALNSADAMIRSELCAS